MHAYFPRRFAQKLDDLLTCSSIYLGYLSKKQESNQFLTRVHDPARPRTRDVEKTKQ